MRRAPGTGSIEPARGGGFWPRLPTRERLDRCTTYEDAEALLDAARMRLASGMLSAPGGITLATWGAKWIDARAAQGIRGTKTERSRWKTHVEGESIGTMPLASVTRATVLTWLDDMLRKRAAPGKGHRSPTRQLARSTIKNVLNLLRGALGAAVERELVAANPAAGVKLPRSKGETHDPWTYLLPEEQAAILTCRAIPVARRCLIAFALGTGLRQGELWNLEVRDVAGGVAVVRYGSKGSATKSGKIRRVPLFGIATEALRAWLPLLRGQPNPLGLLFPLADGSRRQRGAPAWWEGALATAGIDPAKRHDGRHVRWHDLRHSCASSLVAGWWGRRWSAEEIRDLGGWSSIEMVERYAHLADSALEQAARATGVPRVSHRAGGRKEQNPGSHLRDLNSRPTVYENAAFSFEFTNIGRQNPTDRSLVGLARAGLEALAAGGPTAFAEATRALEEIAKLAEERSVDRTG